MTHDAMSVQAVGEGPAVLLLHGTPSPVADWAPLAERLATRFHVIIPALPGYGASPAPRDATMEAIGDAIAAMLARRGEASATLLQSGKVLVVGGYNGNSVTSVEIYHP